MKWVNQIIYDIKMIFWISLDTPVGPPGIVRLSISAGSFLIAKNVTSTALSAKQGVCDHDIVISLHFRLCLSGAAEHDSSQEPKYGVELLCNRVLMLRPTNSCYMDVLLTNQQSWLVGVVDTVNTFLTEKLKAALGTLLSP